MIGKYNYTKTSFPLSHVRPANSPLPQCRSPNLVTSKPSGERQAPWVPGAATIVLLITKFLMSHRFADSHGARPFPRVLGFNIMSTVSHLPLQACATGRNRTSAHPRPCPLLPPVWSDAACSLPVRWRCFSSLRGSAVDSATGLYGLSVAVAGLFPAVILTASTRGLYIGAPPLTAHNARLDGTSL